MAAVAEDTANPYPGPRPFLVADAKYFVGRDRERDDLEDLLFAYRAVLLYAQSGTGKSSLVQAGLLARFEPSRYVLARVSGHEPPDTLKDINVHTYAVLRSCGAGSEAKTLVAALKRTDTEPWFLVLDQFEELFTAYAHRWQEREPFFAEVRDLLEADANVRVLFVMREEYVAELDRYRTYLPQRGDIRYRLERLRRPEALRAIKEPASKSGQPERAQRMEALAEKLVDSLLTVPVETRSGVRNVTGEYIEPLHLQVVCRELWPTLDKASTVDTRELTDVDRVLSTYYDRVVHKVAAWNLYREARIRAWFMRALITPAGTRGIVYMDTAKSEAAGMRKQYVEGLERERLIRPETRAGALWYELTHDRFIGPIQRSNLQWARNLRRRFGVVAAPVVAAGLLWPFALLFRSDAPAPANTRLTQQLEYETTRADTAVDLAVKAADPTLPEQERAAALAVLAANEVRTYTRSFDADKQARAIGLLGTALKLHPETAHRSFFNEAQQQGSPVSFANTFKLTLEGMDRSLLAKDVSADLVRFICRHNYYVIGASEKDDEAEGELKRRWLKIYPHAQLGLPQPELRQTPIVFDYFLTCEEARALAGSVHEKYKSGPIIRGWYTGMRCAPCTFGGR